MKNTFKITRGILPVLLLTLAAFFVACSDDESEVVIPDAPTAGFDFAVSETVTLEVAFTNTSASEVDVTYTWDFGDNSGISTEASPTYTYASGGTYTVSLTATNEGGSDEFTAQVTVEEPVPAVIITNGDFSDGDTGWTIINHYEETNLNGSVTIADGVASFDESTNTDWKHMGIYTTVSLEPGTYQFEMDMSYTEINDVWGEVFLGDTEPVAGSDYGTDQGASLVLKAYNAWDCPDIKSYSGLATSSGCDASDNPGQIEITSAGDFYLVFRTGGATYGTEGIVVDNLSLTKL
ncbi:MAG: PKD domain-containing protein [Cyclobacteriaceae bacterium]